MKHRSGWRHAGVIGLVLLLLSSLLGCEQNRQGGVKETEGSSESPSQTDSAGFVPQERTGIQEQYLAISDNSFECTDTGVYFLCRDIQGDSFLLYGDHGSDTLVKLCGRPDCNHTGQDCNAYFSSTGTSVCYYDGYLYVTTISGRSVKLFRINPDGSDRIEVMDSSGVSPGPGYTGSSDAMAWNGVFSFSLFKIDEEGNEETKSYYYLLDGSMDGAEEIDSGIGWISDGQQCITAGQAQSGVAGQRGLYLWDPYTNHSVHLVDRPPNSTGYWGTETAYYMQKGVVYQQDYADGSSQAVFDTGLKGECRLSCTPDYIIVSEHIPTESELEEQPDLEFTSKVPTLYIYSWDFELLEQVEMPHPVKIWTDDMLCGETEDRLILAAQLFGVPEYYIKKSDIGTGNVEIHPYQLPDLDLGEED